MATANAGADVPRGNAQGFVRYFQHDLLSGFLVFLIALPLCLGISLASGYPAVAGVFTAIVGSIVTSLISNSELTIKGPAAGLIVIALGTITDMKTLAGDDTTAYQYALAIGVTAGVIQIAFGLLKLGILGDFFPTSAVHGMLASIGVLIISKQVYAGMGVNVKQFFALPPGTEPTPLQLLKGIPAAALQLNPAVFAIAAVSLAILIGWTFIKSKAIRRIPPQLVVVLVAVPLGMYLNLSTEHTYSLFGKEFSLGERFLVNVPQNLFGAMVHPDFAALRHPVAWKWVTMFAIIGSLESLLSAKAIDLLDPWQRKTNFNRDMLAVGIANTLAASIGGLPMISEIVRSKANIDNGARTRFADLWHGLFLLAFVALAPALIHKIPLAALAAMLIFTGFRLASPKEFLHVFHVGPEQLIVFVSTIVGVIATDLLLGLLIGIAVKLVIHVLNGVPLRSLFKPYLSIERQLDGSCLIAAEQSAVFSNWILFKRQIENLGLVEQCAVTVDLSRTKFVDHTTMEKLHELQREFEQQGRTLNIIGLDAHRSLSAHEFAARKRDLAAVRRLTVVAEAELEETLLKEFVRLHATGYTVTPCYGAGRRLVDQGQGPRNSQVRIEVIAPAAVCDNMLDFLRKEIVPKHPVTACVETVDVVRPGHY